VLDSFDRRSASRETGLVRGPREHCDSVWLGGFARYAAPGVPDLCFELQETVWIDGDRIRKMDDRYDAAAIADIEAYLREHGAKLGITLG